LRPPGHVARPTGYEEATRKCTGNASDVAGGAAEYGVTGAVPQQSDFLQEGADMTEGCEHWLVQRTINHRYWACVDCELEFRPVERAPASTTEIVRRALGRVGLDER
jgi:hypothetical protein